jgi:predicted nicotinamide N-methyase
MNETDFLWDCAFVNDKNDRLWIIPDEEDFQLNDQDEICQQFNVSSTKYEISSVESGHYVVKVTEKRQNHGVLDIIGGEVWEASLLLSSYIVLNSSKFLDNSNILELGSGVGLPSFLYANMKLASQSTASSSSFMITLTDYDSSLLNNLTSTIKMNYNFCEVADDGIDTGFYLSNDRKILNDHISYQTTPSVAQMNVCSLDWTKFPSSLPPSTMYPVEFDDIGAPMVSGHLFNVFHPDSSILHCNSYEYVIGSALCYASFHAKALFNVICYYLKGKRLKEIIICQIGDREGFSVLLDLLEKNGIAHKVENKISDDIVEYAQRIHCRESQVPVKKKEVTIPREHGQVEQLSLFLEYLFPNPSLEPSLLDSGYERRNLIKSSMDSFSFLHIYKKQKCLK